jgi:nitric oxide reductase subunit B
VVFTGADIQMGQAVFLKYGLMEHGSLWGHGAYLGPDYSAEYLHRLSEVTRDTIATEKYGRPFAQLSPDEWSVVSARTITVLKENRYDPASRSLRLSPGEVAAYRAQLPEWSEYFTRKDATDAYVWSALSLITLLSGLGLILFVVGKFDYLGWKGEGAVSHMMHSAPLALKLTPSQWATGWFFGIVALLFLVQSFLGGVLAHYRVETGAFYGLDIARWLPYNLARTWHLQLAIFWIATAWVGGGLFLASAGSWPPLLAVSDVSGAPARLQDP